MPGELVSAVVTALTAKGAEVLVTGGRDGLAALVRLIRDRFRRQGTDGAAVLQRVVDHPDDQERRRELAELLERLIAEDPTFRERLRSCWRTAADQAAGAPDTVINHFSGRAVNVLQARDIQGDVVF